MPFFGRRRKKEETPEVPRDEAPAVEEPVEDLDDLDDAEEAAEEARQEAAAAAATDAALERTRRSFLGRLTEVFSADVTEDTWESLEEILIGADVGVPTTLEVVERVRSLNLRKADDVRNALAAELVAILEAVEEPRGRLWGPLPASYEEPPRPHIVLVVGVNGTGKTTAIGRLAWGYMQEGKKVVAAAGDTFRAAAIEQIQEWGERVGFEVIAQGQGADPAAVAFDAVQAAQARDADVVLIDTAGRLQNKQNLMAELSKVRRVIERHIPRGPDEVLLVLDATTGQNGLSQAKAFAEAVDVTSVMLTKLDGTGKGGIVFAIAKEFGLPVRFVGVGQRESDLAPFEPRSFVASLLGQPLPSGR
ncbi:MAG: signal recognition particle-docking protein FtsY [Dehalococcoidia bacterium]|nr:signal recognition particle-docking protein FtsY [Dehalococcoidia bacterium]